MKNINQTFFVILVFFITTTVNGMQQRDREDVPREDVSLEDELARLESMGYTATLVGVTQAQDLKQMQQLLIDGADANELVEGLRPLWWAVVSTPPPKAAA